MRSVIIFIVIAVLFYAGFLVLDYFGYYIEWKNPVIGAIVSVPVIQAVLQFMDRPENMLLKNKTLSDTKSKNQPKNNANG